MTALLSTWQFNVTLYIIAYVLFVQFYQQAITKLKIHGAAPIIMELIAAATVLLFSPLFPWTFPTHKLVYGILAISCIFYAIADRLQATIRKNLPVSEFALLNELSSVFIILIGIFFYKEPVTWVKMLGAACILGSNALILYQGGKFKWNPAVLLAIIANIAVAVALSIDVGISGQFNLPLYIMITFTLPAIFIWSAERIPFTSLIAELKQGTAKYFLLAGLCWGVFILCLLRAYRFGSVTLVTPISATTVLFNVLVATLFFGEKGNWVKKIAAACITILGVTLTVM